MSKLQTIGPLGSTSKFNFNGPLGSTSSTSKIKPSDLWEACPKSIHWTSRKHVQISNPQTSGKHVQNFKSIRPLGSMSKIQDHDWNPHFVVTTSKRVFYSFFFSKKKKKKKHKKGCMYELYLDLILLLRDT